MRLAYTVGVRSLVMLAITIAMGADVPVHGHRGARAVLPENTLPAFEYAIASGADWIELDLWATKDNVLVVTHDPAINLKICSGGGGAERLIRNLTLAEVKKWDCGTPANAEYPRQKAVPGTRIPTLDEVLGLAGKGAFRFNVEIKNDPRRPEQAPEPAAYARLVVETIARHKLGARVLIQSFDWRLLHETAKLDAGLKRTALFPSAGQDLGRDYVGIAREANVKSVSVRHDTVTAEKVAAAHKAGIEVIAWTANTEEAWAKLLAAGVDEIITDDPAGLISWLRARGRHR